MKTATNNGATNNNLNGARVVFGNRFADIGAASAEEITWNGAAAETTNTATVSNGRVCYVEIRATGRGERVHTGGVFGLKGMMRFTGSDDSGEWIDVVILAATMSKAA
jgi:hypothetical protein